MGAPSPLGDDTVEKTPNKRSPVLAKNWACSVHEEFSSVLLWVYTAFMFERSWLVAIVFKSSFAAPPLPRMFRRECAAVVFGCLWPVFAGERNVIRVRDGHGSGLLGSRLVKQKKSRCNMNAGRRTTVTHKLWTKRNDRVGLSNYFPNPCHLAGPAAFYSCSMFM